MGRKSKIEADKAKKATYTISVEAQKILYLQANKSGFISKLIIDSAK